jgi:thiol:disulfide interchange protein DsbD
MFKKISTGLLLSIITLTATAQSPLDNLFNENKGYSSGALPVEQAFPIELADNNKEMKVLIDIKPGHYLYADKFKATMNGVSLETEVPNVKKTYDEFFGNVDIVEYGFELDYDYPTNKKEIIFNFEYQGCAKEENLCYPPEKITKTIKNPNYKEESVEDLSNFISDFKSNTQEKVDIIEKEKEQENESVSVFNLATTNNVQDITNFLNKNDNILTVSLIFIGIGVLMAFTPCTYPLMPIIVASTAKTKNKQIASIFYIFGIILAYAAIGLIVGLLNINLQILMQNKIFTLTISGILVLASLYMLGYFNRFAPSSFNNKINEKIMGMEEDKYLNQLVIGFLSTLVVSPCSVAPLLGVLVFINQVEAPLYGSYLLGMLGVGVGIPLFLLNTSLSKILPKNGAWMDEVKNIIAIVLFGISIYLSKNILGENLSNIGFALIAIIYGLHLLGLNLKQKFGIILIFSSIFFLFKNNFENQIQPLKSQEIASSGLTLEYTEVSGYETLNKLIKESNRPVFVDFYADWCITCVRLENKVLVKENIIKYLNDNFLMLKIDLTDISTEEKELMNRRNILAVPYYLFVNKEKKETIYTGELSEEKFLEILKLNNEASNDR